MKTDLLRFYLNNNFQGFRIFNADLFYLNFYPEVSIQIDYPEINIEIF